MLINVKMLAFCDGDIRQVEIPQEEDTQSILDRTFHYGQNEFQPQNLPSVSVGDVVDLGEKGLWLIRPLGFESISESTFAEYQELTQTERIFRSYTSMKND